MKKHSSGKVTMDKKRQATTDGTSEGGVNLNAKRGKFSPVETTQTTSVTDLESKSGIKLTDILGIEHAVINLQNSLWKIIKEAPDHDKLIEIMNASNVQDITEKEILVALTRSDTVKLASILKQNYKEGRAPFIDQILNYSDIKRLNATNDQLDLTLRVGSQSSEKEINQETQDISMTTSSDAENNYPPELPKIKDPVILSRVFMHKSVVNDKTYLTQRQALSSHNERLEFLGDSILNNLITVIIFEMFPDYTEGELSRLRIELVNNHTLTNWSKLYDFDKELIKNISDAAFESGKKKAYADVFEAYIGGLVMDNYGMRDLKDWLQKLAVPIIQSHRVKKLQDLSQTVNKNAKAEVYSLVGCAAMPPRYEVLQMGDGTDIPFIVQCLIKDEELGRGSGANIKEAGLRAAMAALQNKEMIEKYLLIRRAMPRSVSILKQNSNSPEPVQNKTPVVVTDENHDDRSVPLKPLPVSNCSVLSSSSLPIIASQAADHLIDVNAKEKLYTFLSQNKLMPEYENYVLPDGQVEATLKIRDVPFVKSVQRNRKLAGRRAAQVLLENVHLLNETLHVDYSLDQK